ncbi:MAG: hypothetical protein JRF15_16325 [Deltaproteobacteria bacterium]|nr:hypothetical protein [Deltaproteobacteria bacterium]
MTDVPQPRGGQLRKPRIQILAWTAVLIPFFAMAILRWDDGLGIDAGDYAHYLLHARALAEGRSYTDTGYIFLERAWVIGPRAQPPGLPVTLAPFLMLTGENFFVFRLVMLAFATAFVLGAGRYFARREDPILGLGVSLLVGASVPISQVSVQILSDLPFAALVWCLISVYDRDGHWDARRIVAATLLVAAAMSFRTAGIAIIPATLLFTVLQFRQHRWRPAVPILVCAALGAAAAVVGGLFLGVEGRIPSGYFRIGGEFLSRLLFYRFEISEGLLYPFPTEVANDAYHVVALLIVAVGLGAWLKKRWRSYVVTFSVSYGAMLMVVPVKDGRYLWPLFPVLVFGLLNGGRILLERVQRGASGTSQRRGILVAACVIALSSTLFRLNDPPKESLVAWATTQEVFDHLRTAASTDDEMRVAFAKPRVLSWETRIPAMGTFPADPEAILAELRRNRITHVVLGGIGIRGANRAFHAAIRRNPEAFHLQFRNQHFSVYRFAEPQPDSPTGASPINEMPRQD